MRNLLPVLVLVVACTAPTRPPVDADTDVSALADTGEDTDATETDTLDSDGTLGDTDHAPGDTDHAPGDTDTAMPPADTDLPLGDTDTDLPPEDTDGPRVWTDCPGLGATPPTPASLIHASYPTTQAHGDTADTDGGPNLFLLRGGTRFVHSEAELLTLEQDLEVDLPAVDFGAASVYAVWETIMSTCGESPPDAQFFPNPGVVVMSWEDARWQCDSWSTCDMIETHVFAWSVPTTAPFTRCSTVTGGCAP